MKNKWNTMKNLPQSVIKAKIETQERSILKMLAQKVVPADRVKRAEIELCNLQGYLKD